MSASLSDEPLKYPDAPKVDEAGDYHGVRVRDPYRWLEDLDSRQTRAWIDAQNRLTSDYLRKIPSRGKSKERITELRNYERFGMPVRRGAGCFFTRNDGRQNQHVLYAMESPDAAPRVLLDPNTLSKEGTVAMVEYVVSHDGERVAYGLSAAGSDWQEWRVLDVETGKDLGDSLRWIKFSGASWTRDAKGFFYGRYDKPDEGSELKGANYYHKLYYHRVGTPQDEDELVYERKDRKRWLFFGHVTDDGRYLIITVEKGSPRENAVFFRDLSKPESEIVELLRDWDAVYGFVGNDGPFFFFRTDLDAPMGRLIAVDTRAAERAGWREVIGEFPQALEQVSLVGDRFVALYMRDAHSEVRLFDLQGEPLGGIDLPGIGSVWGLQGRRTDEDIFYTFMGFTTPGTVYRYDMRSRKSALFRKPEIKFDPDGYETKQVFYASKDGTEVPMFITHKKGLKLDGGNPTLLWGYGGFASAVPPFFSVGNLAWMELGGIYAQPSLRGGGEYGKAWHEAGRKLKRQNVFDDFIAAAEWLIASGYTRKERLAISGRSNGGLLVGACMTQRPDLFAACVPAMGVLDMLRFHKFTIGWAGTSEYGSPDDPEEFKALYAYSPYHNLQGGGDYPATLIVTADHDDRVFPAHSFKFAARLQECQAGRAPVLIRIETRAGHGMGTPSSKLIEEAADVQAFLMRALGIV